LCFAAWGVGGGGVGELGSWEVVNNLMSNEQWPITENYDIISSSLKQCWVKNVETDKLSTSTHSALKEL
ncbi:hypothetical protein MEN95_15605, partial [Dolichospermum sp. ST_sed7]|nr:hypothetical protein [Dolichospermum sp. ST_sed7]